MFNSRSSFMLLLTCCAGMVYLINQNQYWPILPLVLSMIAGVDTPPERFEEKDAIKGTLFSLLLYVIGVIAGVVLATYHHPWWASALFFLGGGMCREYSENIHEDNHDRAMKKWSKSSLPWALLFAFILACGVVLVIQDHPWLAGFVFFSSIVVMNTNTT